MDISDFLDPFSIWEISQTAIRDDDENAYECPHCNYLMKDDAREYELGGESFYCPHCANELRIL